MPFEKPLANALASSPPSRASRQQSVGQSLQTTEHEIPSVLGRLDNTLVFTAHLRHVGPAAVRLHFPEQVQMKRVRYQAASRASSLDLFRAVLPGVAAHVPVCDRAAVRRGYLRLPARLTALHHLGHQGLQVLDGLSHRAELVLRLHRHGHVAPLVSYFFVPRNPRPHRAGEIQYRLDHLTRLLVRQGEPFT